MTTIAVVDDQPTSRKLLAKLIAELEHGARVLSFGDPEEALAAANSESFDMLFVDYRMPGMDGIEMIKQFRRTPRHRDVPIVLVTISEEHPVRLAALEAGATDFLTKPYDFTEFRARTRNLLTLRHYQMSLKDRARYLEHRVNEVMQEVYTREEDTVNRLNRIAWQRRGVEPAAISRISMVAGLLSEALGVDGGERVAIEQAMPLFDLGKVGIPDALLNQPRALTDTELAEVRNHTKIGWELLRDAPGRALQMAADMARSLYEWFDGNGFPGELKGDQIPLHARMASVIAVLDALMRPRPDRPAWTFCEAMTLIKQASGTQFCPTCVQALGGLSSQLKRLYADPGSDIDQVEDVG